MLRQLLVGAAVSLGNIAIHALVMTAVVKVSLAVSSRKPSGHSLALMSVMIATVSVLMAAHACEVAVWALAYRILDVVPGNAMYFAFVNYTTLGYGDITPVKDWQLLGPLTAMNGVLLFGWSTAVMFEVLRKSMARSTGGTISD